MSTKTGSKFAKKLLTAFPADIENSKTVKNMVKTLSAVFLAATVGAYTALDTSVEQQVEPQQTTHSINHKTLTASLGIAGMSTVALELLLLNFVSPNSTTRRMVQKQVTPHIKH
ncbi:MAG: hypothetical protein HND56_11155 [Pseudomonadota bacterium]|jgi:hypothetical protein|nr:hypothetical protein [Pseudomonadota bacterium]QKK06211.1 MAG: hypothetical protein HND56_11155 [Pseudomonadota bacterium]